MKKVIMMALMAATVSLTAMAQEQGVQRGQGQRQGMRFDPAEMAQRRTDMMAERYGLDQGQKEKLLELNKKYPGMSMGPRMGGPRPGGRPGGDGQMNRQRPQQGNGDNPQAGQGQQRQGFGPGQGPGRGPGQGRFNPEQMKEYEEGLKGIMTPEQYEKYEADMKQRMERMQQRRPDNNEGVERKQN